MQNDDRMFAHTDIRQALWYMVNSDNKPGARLNCIHHLLGCISYAEIVPEKMELPPKPSEKGYIRPLISEFHIVPEVY